jgi:putative transposase
VHKNVKGRKRHIVVDTLGLLLTVMVGCPLGRTANIADRDAGLAVLAPLVGWMPRMRKVWADQGYAGALEAWVEDYTGWELAIVHRPPGMRGWGVLPQRWKVEPGALWAGFAWLGRNRRLSKEYEQLPTSSEAFILIAMIRLMLTRLTRL